MAECMEFPNDWAKFLEDYSFRDHKEFYTNGARLIPTFRVEQMMEHYLRKALTENNVGSNWIPVSERLPEKGRDYLCRCIIDDNNDFPFYMVLRYYVLDKNPHFQHESTHGMHVTHWMTFEPVEVTYV